MDATRCCSLLLLASLATLGQARDALAGQAASLAVSEAAAPALATLPTAVRGIPLKRPAATTAFLHERTGPAWDLPGDIEAILRAIEQVAGDGLRPEDYHRDGLREALAVPH